MKKRVSVLVLLSILLMNCTNDDEPSSNNEVVINNQNFNIDKGYGVESGKSTPSDIHYEYDFILSDGQINVTASSGFVGFTADNATVTIFLLMTSFGDSFQTGTYVFDQGLNQNFSFFDVMSIKIDTNGDSDFNDVEDIFLSATEGSVAVSGTAPNYVLDIDVTLSNGETLMFTYDDALEYIDNRN